MLIIKNLCKMIKEEIESLKGELEFKAAIGARSFELEALRRKIRYWEDVDTDIVLLGKADRGW